MSPDYTSTTPEQVTFGEFAEGSGVSLEFDDFGPTSRRPVADVAESLRPPRAESLAEEPVERTDRENPREIEHFEQQMSKIHDSDDDQDDDSNDRDDHHIHVEPAHAPQPIECPGCGNEFLELIGEADSRAHVGASTCPDCGDWVHFHRDRDDPALEVEDDDQDDDARSTTRAVATDGGQEVREPKDDPEPGDEVLLIENPAVGLNTSPNIITGEVSGSGKSVMVPEGEGSSNSQKRLDASEIFAGESEFRDSTGFELYTPGRLRSRQRSNFAPGPQAGSNGKSDIGDLPEPTHWPAGDEPDDAPDMCPACGETGAPWNDVGKPRCERCGETIDPDADEHYQDEEPGKWDLERLDRGDTLIIDGYRAEFVVTKIHTFVGTDTVNRIDIAKCESGEWSEFSIQKVSRPDDNRLKVNEDGEPSVAINVDNPELAGDFEVTGNSEEMLRRYIREGYYGD